MTLTFLWHLVLWQSLHRSLPDSCASTRNRCPRPPSLHLQPALTLLATLTLSLWPCLRHCIVLSEGSSPLQLFPNSWVLKLQMHWNHLQGLWKHGLLPSPWVFSAVDLGWNAKVAFLTSSWWYWCCWTRVHAWWTPALILSSDLRANGLDFLTCIHCTICPLNLHPTFSETELLFPICFLLVPSICTIETSLTPSFKHPPISAILGITFLLPTLSSSNYQPKCLSSCCKFFWTWLWSSLAASTSYPGISFLIPRNFPSCSTKQSGKFKITLFAKSSGLYYVIIAVTIYWLLTLFQALCLALHI